MEGKQGSSSLESKIDAIARELGEVKVLVAGMMPRAEVDGELARRVSLEVYTADQRATNERLMRLESSPQKLLGWASAGIGCLGVAMSAVAIVVGIVEYIVMHH